MFSPHAVNLYVDKYLKLIVFICMNGAKFASFLHHFCIIVYFE